MGKIEALRNGRFIASLFTDYIFVMYYHFDLCQMLVNFLFPIIFIKIRLNRRSCYTIS